MTHQRLFDFFETLPRLEREKDKSPRPRSGTATADPAKQLTRAEYILHLNRALHQLAISQPLYTLLLAVYWHTCKFPADPLSLAALAHRTGRSYHAIREHVADRPCRAKSGKGSPHLFHLDLTGPLTTITLSPEGTETLTRVHNLVTRFANQP